MRRYLGALALLAGCQALPPQGVPAGAPAAPPGVQSQADCARLVPIFARDTAQGLAREVAWLAENRPAATILGRREERCGETPVHRVTYIEDGVHGVVMFDVSSYFGRVDGDDLDDLLDG